MLLATGFTASEGQTGVSKTYNMRFSGDVVARFSGHCMLATSDGEKVLTLEGRVPHERELIGQSLSCRFQVEGRVVIEIEHDGSRTRSTSESGTISVSLR